MQQKVEPRHPLTTPAYDPETDPVLAQLRRHKPSGAGGKIFVGVAIAGLLAIAGWYAYSVNSSRQTVQPEPPRQVEATPAAVPAPTPPVSPLQAAEEWYAENLATTEFAGLPLVEAEGAGFFVVYKARSGDSIGSVVKRYGAGFGAGSAGEILDEAKRLHAGQYGGRGLWVGDEIRLVVPMKPGV